MANRRDEAAVPGNREHFQNLFLDAGAIPGGRERLQNFFLHAARVLMLYSAVGAISIAGNPGSGNATQAFICLLLWLLGVCFLALVPTAERLPQAAMVAAAVASAGLRHLFTPGN